QGLGLPFLPPYFGGQNGRPKNFQKGVNFAVVGATALDDAFFKERGIKNPFTNVSLGVELGLFKEELIELGAVTFLVPGNLPIGCSPAYLTYFQGSDKGEYDPLTGCLTWLNQFSEYHNELLQQELDQIRELHPHVNIIYADYYNIAMREFPTITAHPWLVVIHH
ncbi:hypothetical protein QQP08_020756, partial [Theobroma cacao]